MPLITSIMIGIGLSMDTFSLSLICGIVNISNKRIYTLSIIVGIYHFVMPLIGISFGRIIIDKIFLEPEHILSIIFSIIGIQMIVSLKKKQKNTIVFNILGMLFFGFTVSIDSFSTGIGLDIINPNIYESVIIFSIISAIFTFIGLKLGKQLNKRFGDYSVLSGGLLLIAIAVYYLTK